jgi:hypothetical protein
VEIQFDVAHACDDQNRHRRPLPAATEGRRRRRAGCRVSGEKAEGWWSSGLERRFGRRRGAAEKERRDDPNPNFFENNPRRGARRALFGDARTPEGLMKRVCHCEGNNRSEPFVEDRTAQTYFILEAWRFRIQMPSILVFKPVS